MLSNGALNRRHTIAASAAGGGGAGLYNAFGMAVERPSSNDGLRCLPGCDDATSYAKDKKLRKKQRLDVSDPWCILAMAGLLLFAWAMHGRAQRAWVLKELHVQTFEEALQAFRNLQEQHHMAEEDLEHEYAITERLQKRDRAWKEQAEWLQNATKKESHRAVVDKFGPGPHLVHVTVHFEGAGGESPSDETFAIELAPIKYVPHAVHFFLEQVSHGLWNHSAFHLNHHHVLQVGPSTPEHRDRFRDLELDRLAFPDYSPHYPHHRWTLGFAGRPGGPSWYVNKIDNRADHGPHGQEHHALSEFADSCFGRIVDGFDVLERVFAGATRATILSASVVNWHDHSDNHFDYDEWHKEHEDYHDSSDYDEDGSDYWFDDDRHIQPHLEGQDGPTHKPDSHLSTDAMGGLHSPATQGHEGGRSHPTLEEQLKSYYSSQQTKQAHPRLKK